MADRRQNYEHYNKGAKIDKKKNQDQETKHQLRLISEGMKGVRERLYK